MGEKKRIKKTSRFLAKRSYLINMLAFSAEKKTRHVKPSLEFWTVKGINVQVIL